MLGARVFAANEVYDAGSSGDRLNDGSKFVKSKTRRSNNQKTSKSRKLAKSKKLSKNGNSPNFNAKNSGLSFLTPKARAAFNRLQLAFTKALILWYFDPECYIQIKIDALGYAIGSVLSQLVSRTRLDKVVTKANLR